MHNTYNKITYYIYTYTNAYIHTKHKKINYILYVYKSSYLQTSYIYCIYIHVHTHINKLDIT